VAGSKARGKSAKKQEDPFDFTWGLNVASEDYIGFVPTPMKIVHRMLELAEIEAGQTVYDLGCGDGRILITAVQKYAARGVGIDIDGARLDTARKRARHYLDRIAFREQNLFKVDLRPADVVTLYLLPSLNEKLMPRLAKLKRGSRIVTHCFELPDMVADKVARRKCVDGLGHNIYVYRTPLRKAPTPAL
jgi:SAM-dependent methyltransferase